MSEDKKYGGYTLEQLRVQVTEPTKFFPRAVVNSLIREIEAMKSTELLSRMRRIETRLHKFMVFMGAESAETTMTVTATEFRDRIVMNVPGYDVTLSQLRRAVDAREVAKSVDKPDACKPVFIAHGDALLGTLRLTESR